MRKLTFDEFKERALKKHGDRYIYSNETYVNTSVHTKIQCNKCGNVFMQKPNNHLNGQGCPYCANNQKLTTNKCVEKIKSVHGDKYDYSKVEYLGNDKKVCLICHKKDEFGEEHGEFWVTPHSIIGMGTGCPKCSNKFSSKERFEKLANKRHDSFYSYDNFEYNGAKKSSYVTCPKHGDFMITPNDHLNGKGCPKCHVSEIENDILVMLEKHNIKYQLHKRDLEYLNGLELDFYLPDYNIAIECQGEQHFKPVNFFGGKDKFKETNANDTFKRNKCKENGIKLLYYSKLGIKYPYKVFEDKEKLLKEIINE